MTTDQYERDTINTLVFLADNPKIEHGKPFKGSATREGSRLYKGSRKDKESGEYFNFDIFVPESVVAAAGEILPGKAYRVAGTFQLKNYKGKWSLTVNATSMVLSERGGSVAKKQPESVDVPF